MAHQHYKGTGKVHSFRGLMEDGDQRRIRIQGATGEIAWRITKFEVVSRAPVGNSPEAIIKIFREEQSTVDAYIDFDNDELLAAAFLENNQSVAGEGQNVVIFDNALFSRNVYVTTTSTDGAINYYIELEEVKVSAAGMAQLAVAAARRVVVTD